MKRFYFRKDTAFNHVASERAIVKDYLHIWRTMDDCELFVVLDGEIFIDQEGEQYCLHAGDYLLTERHKRFGGHLPSNGVFHWMHFDFPAEDAVFSETDVPGFEFSFPKQGRLDTCDSFHVLMLLVEQYARHVEKRQVGNILLSGLLQDLASENMPVKYGKSIDSRFQPIMDYFHNTPYCNEFTNGKTMAEFFGYSEKYLIRLFKRNTGMSPKQFLISQKVLRAQRLLAMTDQTVRAIAAVLNYDYYYFMRIFRKTTGMSPTQFRKSVTPEWRRLYGGYSKETEVE